MIADFRAFCGASFSSCSLSAYPFVCFVKITQNMKNSFLDFLWIYANIFTFAFVNVSVNDIVKC